MSKPIEFQGAGKARAKSSRGAYMQYVSSETSAQHSQNLKGDGFLEKLPQPDANAQHISNKLVQHIRAAGKMSFVHYMELALYTPRLGYYSGGAQKLGPAGDFITAPEISPLFGQCLAVQIAEVLLSLGGGDVLEFGAGSGRLAVDILAALAKQNVLPNHYYILEVSADLSARQQAYISENLPELKDRVIWLSALPEEFSGVMLANEVLDAMPVHRFCQTGTEITESFVAWDEGFRECFQPAGDVLSQAVRELNIISDEAYISEINLALPAWINSLSESLKQGIILLVDYGFPRREYYHPQRHMGTLNCHYRHHAHEDFFFYPGLQDITSHVDFTSVAESAVKTGLDVLGYTTQAYFLMACGLTDMADKMGSTAAETYKISQQIKKLALPSEMGELFKVIALARNVSTKLRGFGMHDMRQKL